MLVVVFVFVLVAKTLVSDISIRISAGIGTGAGINVGISTVDCYHLSSNASRHSATVPGSGRPLGTLGRPPGRGGIVDDDGG